MAQYIDNDEDGIPDDSVVLKNLVENNVVVPVLKEEDISFVDAIWNLRCGRKFNFVASMYYDLPSTNLEKYVNLVKEPITITFGNPAYIKMPAVEEVEMNTIYLKSSLKPLNNDQFISKGTNHYY